MFANESFPCYYEYKRHLAERVINNHKDYRTFKLTLYYLVTTKTNCIFQFLLFTPRNIDLFMAFSTVCEVMSNQLSYIGYKNTEK